MLRGKAIPEVAKELEISENNVPRWRAEHPRGEADSGGESVARDLASAGK